MTSTGLVWSCACRRATLAGWHNDAVRIARAQNYQLLSEPGASFFLKHFQRLLCLFQFLLLYRLQLGFLLYSINQRNVAWADLVKGDGVPFNPTPSLCCRAVSGGIQSASYCYITVSFCTADPRTSYRVLYIHVSVARRRLTDHLTGKW